MQNELSILRKLKGVYCDPIEYYVRIYGKEVCLNSWVGKTIQLSYTGCIYCIQCERRIKKSFQQGFCFPCFLQLKECKLCIIHPERCMVEQGVCSVEHWAHSQCFGPHIVYLANSSGLKVGITRQWNLITRWIDQGALQGLPLLSASNRCRAGMVEVALKAYVADRTNWRVMLKNEVPLVDLLAAREDLYSRAKDVIASLRAESPPGTIDVIASDSVTRLNYPILEAPTRIAALSFDKNPMIQGRLLGIKGQYLIFHQAVLNIRKFGGYEVNWQLA